MKPFLIVACVIVGVWFLSSQAHSNGSSSVSAQSTAVLVAATVGPTLVPVHPTDKPIDAVKLYYDDINNRQFAKAYGLLSPAAQRRHTFTDFVAYQSSIDTTVYNILGLRSGVVLLSVGEHHANDAENLQIVTGGWHVIASADGRHWLLDRVVFSAPKIVAAAPPASTAPAIATNSSATITQPAVPESQAPGRDLASQGGPPLAPAYVPPSFHGFACDEATCAGHERGYEWASEKGIDDPHSCYHGRRLSNPNMRSFSEGCEAYVDENTGAARLDESERYTEDDNDTDDVQ